MNFTENPDEYKEINQKYSPSIKNDKKSKKKSRSKTPTTPITTSSKEIENSREVPNISQEAFQTKISNIPEIVIDSSQRNKVYPQNEMNNQERLVPETQTPNPTPVMTPIAPSDDNLNQRISEEQFTQAIENLKKSNEKEEELQNNENNLNKNITRNAIHEIEHSIPHEIQHQVTHEVPINVEHEVQHFVDQQVVHSLKHNVNQSVNHEIKMSIHHSVKHQVKRNVSHSLHQIEVTESNQIPHSIVWNPIAIKMPNAEEIIVEMLEETVISHQQNQQQQNQPPQQQNVPQAYNPTTFSA